MDPLIARESERIDPHIPFRAKTTHHHHTWARTYYSRPELYIQPETTEEIQKVITLARRCRRRIVTVGSGHSPSDLTCTSSWMVNLDRYSSILSVNPRTKIVVMQAGIRVRDLCKVLEENGLAMPNLGSINEQSIAGAMSTGTHGSSLKHDLISSSVLALKIMLANGRTVLCSAEQNEDLFRAALVSLGALGIITEVTFQAVPDFNLSWDQHLVSQDEVLQWWDQGLWTEKEFTRVWLFPYIKKCVLWRAEKTHEARRAPKASWFSGRLGYHIYHGLLYLAHYIPSILPSIERFVMLVQYGGPGTTGVEKGRTGLLMNCLYSQFVNEWAIPLEKGPEALTRLSAWLHGDRAIARMPFDSRGIYVHAPIEVRVSQATKGRPQPYLSNLQRDGPTLLLNATLYRPYDLDPPCRKKYYEAFEWLMKEVGGRPHWAKNIRQVSGQEIQAMYPEMAEWRRVRNEADPEGMFVGEWHRRYLLSSSSSSSSSPSPSTQGEGEEEGEPKPVLPLEERELAVRPRLAGGLMWVGEIPGKTLSPQISEESFDLMHGAEAEKSFIAMDESQESWQSREWGEDA